MGQTLDCLAKVYNSLNHIGQKKPSPILTTSVNQSLTYQSERCNRIRTQIHGNRCRPYHNVEDDFATTVTTKWKPSFGRKKSTSIIHQSTKN